MEVIRRLRLPALFCTLAVLFCELISSPYTTTGICDDGPYILVAKNLAATGTIHYNGWSAAMLCWQLYLGAAFIKLFGFSFTSVRMSTLLIALAGAFLLQRILVRCGISERNAVIGTLGLVLSPLYLMLSVTFMSDIHGLFGIIICLYACLRALQAFTDRATISWLCVAVAANVAVGTSRQLAWLGVIVMVPCTVWLLRSRRRVCFVGAAATAAGVLSIYACLIWLNHQPYTLPESFQVSSVPYFHICKMFTRFFLEMPFLLLPITVLFLLGIQTDRRQAGFIVCGLIVASLFVAFCSTFLRGDFRSLLEPTLASDWIMPRGEFVGIQQGSLDTFLSIRVRGLVSVLSFGGTLALIISIFGAAYPQRDTGAVNKLTWKQLGILLGPFSVAYICLLFYRAASVAHSDTPLLLDRYSLGLLLIALICLVRQLQERVQPSFLLAGSVSITIMAVYGVAVTHNTFALYRARVLLAAEIRASGIPDTSVDQGWDYNLDVELEHASYINDALIRVPAGAYTPAPPLLPSKCSVWFHQETPHIRPVYSVSFNPKACGGVAPLAPVHYSRWLAAESGTLYLVNYGTPSNH